MFPQARVMAGGAGIVVSVTVASPRLTGVFPGARGHRRILRTGEHQDRYTAWSSRRIEVTAMRQADYRCNRPENWRATRVLAQLPSKHSAIRSSRCEDPLRIDAQLGFDLFHQGDCKGDVIGLTLRP